MGTLSLVWGLALAPMGWVLLVVATATPQWWELPKRPSYPRDFFFSDGLWESCVEVLAQPGPAYRTLPEDMAHFWPMWVLRAATVGSLLLGSLAYALPMLGAWWWVPPPRPNLVATAGLLLTLAGAMYVGAASYMADRVLQDLASPQSPPADRFHLGMCLYLGWSGRGAEVVAGICQATSLCRKRGFIGEPAAAPYEVDYRGAGTDWFLLRASRDDAARSGVTAAPQPPTVAILHPWTPLGPSLGGSGGSVPHLYPFSLLIFHLKASVLACYLTVL